MGKIIILTLLCIAIFGCVIYFFVLDEKKDIFAFLRQKQTNKPTDGQHVDTSLLREGLQHVVFHHPLLKTIHGEIHKKIIGMESFINAIIINMLCGSHMLIEGVPGLAKTKTVHTFADIMGMDFKRIQFTP
ncbi:MAG: AAA family ATPase, partial [Candidatus Absconditabacterales bacterium]